MVMMLRFAQGAALVAACVLTGILTGMGIMGLPWLILGAVVFTAMLVTLEVKIETIKEKK